MRRIDALTSLRGFAALWVVLFHLQVLPTPVRGRLGQVIAHGHFGVDLFFVLSGFVLSLVYADRMPGHFHPPAYRAFLVQRLAKIYPLHLLTLAATAVMVLVLRALHYRFTSGAEYSAWSALCSALMLHAFGLTSNLSWNVPSWSVSAEWFAYAVLLVPMLVWLRRVSTPWLCAALCILLAAMGLAEPMFHVRWTELDTLGIVRILPEFLAGYVLFRLLHGRTLRHSDAVAATGAALLLLACYVPSAELWLLVPGLMILLTGLYTAGPVTSKLFDSRLLVRLGDASYSIYLLQSFVLTVSKLLLQRLHLPDTAPVRALITVTVPAAAVAVGLLCFHWIEEPLRVAVLQRFGRKRNPERQVPSSPSGGAPDTQVSATIG